MTTPQSVEQKEEVKEEPATGWSLALAAVVILLLIAIFTHRRRSADIDATPTQNNRPMLSFIYTTPKKFKLCQESIVELDRARKNLKKAGMEENGMVISNIQTIIDALKLVEVAPEK